MSHIAAQVAKTERMFWLTQRGTVQPVGVLKVGGLSGSDSIDLDSLSPIQHSDLFMYQGITAGYATNEVIMYKDALGLGVNSVKVIVNNPICGIATEDVVLIWGYTGEMPRYFNGSDEVSFPFISLVQGSNQGIACNQGELWVDSTTCVTPSRLQVKQVRAWLEVSLTTVVADCVREAC
jgi:hypothetical protein